MYDLFTRYRIKKLVESLIPDMKPSTLDKDEKNSNLNKKLEQKSISNQKPEIQKYNKRMNKELMR